MEVQEDHSHSPIPIFRSRSLRQVTEVATRLRAEGMPCAVSGHPEPWWVWQTIVLGRYRVLVSADNVKEARCILKFFAHIDDAITFDDTEVRPTNWKKFQWAIALILFFVILFFAVGPGLQGIPGL